MWAARVTVDIDNDRGFMVIKTGIDPEVQLYLPVLKDKTLDGPEGFSSDVLYQASKIVPEITGITSKYREAFSEFTHKDVPRMLQVFDYVRSNLMYGLYNENNPGHLFVLIQCFGGWWAGVATQIFASVLLRECSLFRIARAGPESMDLDLMFGMLACICKAFGTSARTPLIPHYPQGTPPDPIALFADTIASRYKHLKRPLLREELIKSLINWHIPRYMRHLSQEKDRQLWQPHNHIDRTRAFMEKSLK